jgi:ATP-dependent Lhr-like helicase
VSPLEELHPALRYHIVNTLGWTDMRPTQLEAIRPIQSGENVLLLAPTAGGKTEAVAFPLLSRMTNERWRGLSVLYVCPLRALLNNLEPRLHGYAAMLGRRASLWHGDVADTVRRRIVRDPPDLLLTTPESLEAIMISTRVDHATFFADVRAVVVDELHAFAGDDRGWHLLFLLGRLERLVRRQIQRIGMSATIGNPEELLAWISQGRGGRVVGPAHPPSDGDVTTDYVGSVSNAVSVLSRMFRGERRLVFADSRSRVEQIAQGLQAAGLRTFVSHASLSAEERRSAEAAFAAEPDCIIVATSTLELGIDVGDLDRVIQVGAPPTIGSFLQRMGRTGRRVGSRRNCLFLATNDEELLTALAVVALWREGVVESVVPPPRPSHIYAQQVMALVLQERGVSRSDIDAWLGAAVNEVDRVDRLAILRHMLDADVLTETEGVIGFGPRGEREFGRRHFGDLVAAFNSPMILAVHHGALELGTIQPASLSMSGGEKPVLLLGGKSWKVTNVDWPRRRVDVVSVQGGGRSRWLGEGRNLTARVCHAAEGVVAGNNPACALSQRSTARLAEVRESLAFVDGSSLPVVFEEDRRVRVWCFAGGLATAALARSLRQAGVAVASHDDFSISVRDSEYVQVSEALKHMDAAAVQPNLPDDLASALKFSLCLPDQVIRTVLSLRFADPASINEVLSRSTKLVHQAA